MNILKEKWQSDDGKSLDRNLTTSNHIWNEIESEGTIEFSFETKFNSKVQNSSHWRWNIEFESFDTTNTEANYRI